MTAATSFRTISPTAEEHLWPIGRLAADAFSGGQYVEQYCQNYIGNSHYDWPTSRVVLDGEKLVHQWGVWGYRMRVESVQLKVAGVGAVVTHPDYRKQGLMYQAARASFEAMQQAGYDLSILRGRHYVKLGYARAWNYVTYYIKPEELPGLPPAGPYQPLRPEQVPEMDALYNRTHAGFTGTAVRPTFLNRHADDIGAYAWLDEQGKLAGYIRALPSDYDPKILHCLEAAGDPRQGLALLVDLFQKGAYDRLACFTMPHLHPMLQQLRRGACVVEDRYFDVSGWRVRLINLRSALLKLVPLLEQRLAQSRLAGWRGSLLLDGGEQQATLHIDRGRVEIAGGSTAENVLEGGANVARFFIGSDEPDEIIRQADMECGGLARSLAGVLFPRLQPMLSQWDEF